MLPIIFAQNTTDFMILAFSVQMSF